MARILSISYNEALLFTRELILRDGGGHTVRSALGFVDAIRECETTGHDLLVLGHSIPKNDKVKLIDCFRKSNPKAVVVALIRANEPRLAEVDAYVYPGNPDDLLRSIGTLIHPSAERGSDLRRVK